MSLSERWLVGLLLAGAFLFRLAHLTGPLDEPAWRQADTAYMAYRMMDESPPDLLNPKAPYRGTNDVKAAEFPIYPAIVAYVYKAVGHESLRAARAVTLLFFLGSAWLLFLSARVLGGERVAWWTVVLYSAAPLGIAYSRMVHPDFSIVFFSHLFLYALLCFVRSGRWGWWGIAVLGGTAAFLMKAPYCFYLGLLPGCWWLVDRGRRTWGRFAGLALVLVLPLAAALWFNHHRIAQEAPFAESLVYPMKWTAESSAGRFFGTIADRLDPDGWRVVVKRMLWLVLTPAGVVLALLGLWPPRRGAAETNAPRALPLVWVAGAGLYALVVFPMVAGGHEYYTLPLVAPAALLAAQGLVRAVDAVQRRLAWSSLVTSLLLAGLLALGVREGLARGPYLEGLPYFGVDWQRVEAGKAIRSMTAPEDLVLSLTHGRSTGWSDPRILYFADRRGWAMELRYIDEARLDMYRQAGASVAAVLVTPEADTGELDRDVLGRFPFREERIAHNGKNLGSVRVYDLSSPGT